MPRLNKLFTAVSAIQLVVSVLLGIAVCWGYSTYRASVGQFVTSVARSIDAVADVVIRTAETVEARKELLVETEGMLVAARGLVTELRQVTEAQAKDAPRYAEGLHAASSVLGKLSAPIQRLGDTLTGVSVPSIQMDGIKPVVTNSRPFEAHGKQVKDAANEIKAVAGSLSGIATSIGRDGARATSAVIATSEQALRLVAEAEKTLSRLKAQDLPKAIADLRTSARELRSMSGQIDTFGRVGEVLFAIGLLLVIWCFFHSLGALMLAGSGVHFPENSAVMTNSQHRGKVP